MSQRCTCCRKAGQLEAAARTGEASMMRAAHHSGQASGPGMVLAMARAERLLPNKRLQVGH